MTEGRTRSYTDADGFLLIKQETSDPRSSTFVRQQTTLRRGINSFKQYFLCGKF